MADIQKKLEKAEKYLQKGKPEDALEVYMEILEDDPNQDGVRQSAADVAVTLGKNSEAASLLSALFDRQAAIGDQAKAVINYKKLARLGTPNVDQTFKYSQFIEKSDKRSALEGYQLVAGAFEAADRHNDMLAARKRIVGLEPSAANYKLLADAAERNGDKKTAADALYHLAELEPANAGAQLEKGYGFDSGNAPLALAYAKWLTANGKAASAVEVLMPYARAAESGPEFRTAYGQALMGAGRAVEAEPMVFEEYEKHPEKPEEVTRLIGALLKQDHQDTALHAAQRLEQVMTKHSLRREYISLIKDVTTEHPPSAEFLEYLVGVYNSGNREHDYCDALINLFQIYFATGKFLKAADSLDRAAEVDPYQQGNQKRLEMLKGKIDQNRYNAIAHRFQSVGAEETTGEKKEETSEENEPTVLEDFLLQAEIFIQYGMRSKALERIERINKLFPHEEEKNEKLHALYANAGYVPKYEGPAAAPAAPAAPASAPASPFGQAPSYGAGNPNVPATSLPQMSQDENAVDNFSRVTEITRNIYRQSTVKGVLFAAVNDVGRHYNASRCIAGLISPGKPPSAALEYCAPGIKQSEVQHIVKLLGAMQASAMRSGLVSVDNAVGAPDLAGIKDSISALGVKSLLAAPLLDAANDEHVGVLLLEQCDRSRAWRSTDAVVLKTIADQMVLAVNNAKLRSLMKNLAVTDEKSGLLKRSSYLDVLLSETKRALSQNSTLSVLLFNFGKASALVKEIGETGVENLMQQIGQAVCSQVRQNDVAVRYELTTLALLLPDTTDKNAFFVVDKMRKVLGGFKITGSEKPVPITVGIAEAVMHSEYDPIDIVTEVINRAEAALEAAKTEGPNAAKSLAPQMAAEVAA